MARYEMGLPCSLVQLEPMIIAAQVELAALCQGKRFRMSIPVDTEDSDMVIGDALRHSLAFVLAALGRSTVPDAVDPHLESEGTPTTRADSSSSAPPPDPSQGSENHK